MEGKDVFVVVDSDGELIPYIADDIYEAMEQHQVVHGTEILGAFKYGNPYVTTKEAI